MMTIARYGLLVLFGLVGPLSAADESLRERIKDANGVRTDVWVYNDIRQAMDEARKQNKPLFVTFRCVPCKDCAAFDADVANGNERVRDFAREKFVSVRQVEMKGVDLSLFQFDHDLNWAGMFINADGVVYARYGTQSAEGSDAYNSIDGLLNTMNRVLELHAGYPKNLAELKGKRGPDKPVSSALELPGLRNPEKYAQQTERGNCIHCHNIHDAEHRHALNTGAFSTEMLWKYPLPDAIGLKIDRKSGVRIEQVVAGSAAASTKLRPNEDVVRMNGQRIASIADMQWVLHHLPNTDTQVEVETSAAGKQTVPLKAGWKRSDFSWRGSMWDTPPRLQFWAPPLTGEAREKLNLPETDTPLEVRWINREGKAGQQAFDDGLREKDVIVAIAGQPLRMDTKHLHMHVKLNYKVGDVLPLTVLRNGKREEIKISLVE
ncbi:MAG TPA: Trx7/PDZ domain-containing (seleno)protein [Planctomycetaceae bacterium]|nr:Trx7/PDZ domain-containing (seleno)protein [Planctomycetaceae bacterium]